MAKARTRKRATVKREPDTKAAPELLMSSIVAPSEFLNSRYLVNGFEAGLVARGMTGTPYWAAMLNAQACSNIPIRLYRPKSNSAKVWATRGVSKSQARFLLSQRHIIKAVSTAGVADDSVEEVLDHPSMDVIWNPDPWMVGTTWWLLLYWFGEITGKVYAYHGGEMEPAYLTLMYPQWTSVEAERGKFITGFTYGRQDGPRLSIPSEAVMYHRPMANPKDPLDGVSWLHSVGAEADVEAAAVQSELNRWHQGGQPGMAIQIDKEVDDKQARRARAELNAQIRGVNKAGEALFLKNATLLQYGSKPHEMNYKDGRVLIRESIFGAAGIPEPVWKMADSNKASAVASNPQYMRNTISPKVSGICETLTEKFLTLFPGTEGWYFGFADPVGEDVDAQHTRLKDMHAARAATTNEWRRVNGMDPMEGGDEIAPPPAPVIPGGDNEETPEKPEAPDDRPSGGGDDDGKGGGDTGVGSEDEPKGANRHDYKVPHVLSGDVRDGAKANPQLKNARGGEAIIADFEGRIRAWYEKVITQGVRSDGTVDVAPFMAEFNAITSQGLRNVMTAQGLEALQRIGEPADVSKLEASAGITRYVQERGLSLATSVEGTLKEVVANRIGETVNAGGTIADAQRAILAEAPQLSAYQAERLVRTESAFAQTEADVAVWSEAGWQGKQWSLSSQPCPVCEAFGAKYTKAIPVGDQFEAGGVSVSGPPAHPNCSCSLIPVQELDNG